MQTFRSLIGMWPSVAAFSRETGIGYEASKKWPTATTSSTSIGSAS